VRINFPDPPIVSRNLYHASAALWDAFWLYQENGWGDAQALFRKEIVDPANWSGGREAAQAQAMSHAVYRVVRERYKSAFNSESILLSFRDLMLELGYDPDDDSIEGDGPAAVGNRIGFAIIEAGLSDGSNEANGYADATGYAPVNDPLIYGTSGVTLNDPNRWQPLSLEQSVTKNGIDLGEETQTFLTPGWNWVTPFALDKPTESTILIDPGAQPLFGTATETQYIAENVEVIEMSAMLDPDDPTTIDASPGAMQNNPFLTQDGTGRAINPFTGEAYAPNPVNRADYWRVTAEFWSDGPGIEGPPGVWNMLHNQVVDDPRFERRFGGEGPELSPLEWDVHAYLAINGALHDAAIAAWTIKSKYDSIRPVSMIRFLASLGQFSDPEAPSYHESGLPLQPGLIELITEESSSPGQRHEHLSEFVDELALNVWKGVPNDPQTETAGTAWIRAADWTPYHLRTFPTPNFAGYVSGHSTFARAGAEVLAMLTGSPFFPGGLKEFEFKQGEILQVEYGPSEDLTIQCATYYDAADLTGIARLFCGVHIAADDFVGRKVGARAGIYAFLKVNAMRDTQASMNTPRLRYALGPGRTTPLIEVESANERLPVRFVADSKLAISSPESGLYFAHPNNAADSIVELIVKGETVEGLKIKGIIQPDAPLELSFDIDSDSLGHFWALGRQTSENDDASISLSAYRIVEGVVTLIEANDSWIEGDSASIIQTLADKSEIELRSDSTALPLSVSRGSYKLVLESDRRANVSLEARVVR